MENYVNIFSEVVLIFGISIECVSGCSTDFPWGIFWVGKLISGNVVGTFGSLLAVTVDEGHFLGNELFGFSLSCRCSTWKLWSWWLLAVLYFSKCWVYLCVGKLYQVLISVDLFLFLFFPFFFLCVHFCLFYCYFQ